MERLARTPSILLEIIQLSDISTLLNLRLADRAIWCLISTYEASISTAIAEHSFPNHHLRVRPQNHPKPTVKWLLELRRREVLARRLSAVSVEKGNGWICWDALLYILTYVKHMMFTFLLAMLRTSTALQEILQRQRERQLRFTLHPRWFDLAGSYTNVSRHIHPQTRGARILPRLCGRPQLLAAWRLGLHKRRIKPITYGGDTFQCIQAHTSVETR